MGIPLSCEGGQRSLEATLLFLPGAYLSSDWKKYGISYWRWGYRQKNQAMDIA